MSRHPYTYASDYIRHLAGYKHGQKAHCFNRGMNGLHLFLIYDIFIRRCLKRINIVCIQTANR